MSEDTMALPVRAATQGDAPALIGFDHVAAIDPSRARQICDAIAAGLCFVADLGGRPAGYVIFNPRFLGHGFAELLYTDPACRRRGVGSALLADCEVRCLTPKLFISTNLSNKPMQALLAKLGFVMTGFIDNIDEGDPELVYFKRLAAKG
jgi:ribosomal protein S18 acetylase RimI-like enzyme